MGARQGGFPSACTRTSDRSGQRTGRRVAPHRDTAALPAFADDLLLPESTSAEPILAPTTRVTVRADGGLQHVGASWTPADELILPGLSAALRAWHEQTADGVMLVAGDRRADFRAVRSTLATANNAGVNDVGFLAGPETQPPRAIRVTQTVADVDILFFDGEARQGGLVPLALHLRDGSLVYTRDTPGSVALPDVNGALDLPRLALLLDEDRRLHPSSRLVLLNTDDGVPYADTFAVLDLARVKGYTRTLLAGGPPETPPETPPGDVSPSRPPAQLPVDIPIETPISVVLRPGGDIDLRAPDGSVELVRFKVIQGFEAWCDTSTCDIVADASGRRVFLGARERATPFPDALFGMNVATREGRLGLPAPQREGGFSPIRQLPGTEHRDLAPGAAARAGDPIVLGSLDKGLIDGVIKKNMARVRRCYEEALDRDDSISGLVAMKFLIGKDGSVPRAVIKETAIDDPVMLECMTSTFASFVFPPPKGVVVVLVTYPFVFSPG